MPQKLTPQQKQARRGRHQGAQRHGLHGRRGPDPAPPDRQRRPQGRGVEDRRGLLLDVTFTKVGEEQSITAPANPKPFSELLKAVDAAGLADLGLGGGGSGDDAERPRTGTPNNVDKYADCIEKAGGDRAKARECAALLSG